MFGKRKKKPKISNPLNFEHRVHTDFDIVNGSFVGLPKQWSNIVEKEGDYARPQPITDPSQITPVKVREIDVWG